MITTTDISRSFNQQLSLNTNDLFLRSMLTSCNYTPFQTLPSLSVSSQLCSCRQKKKNIQLTHIYTLTRSLKMWLCLYCSSTVDRINVCVCVSVHRLMGYFYNPKCRYAFGCVNKIFIFSKPIYCWVIVVASVFFFLIFSTTFFSVFFSHSAAAITAGWYLLYFFCGYCGLKQFFNWIFFLQKFSIKIELLIKKKKKTKKNLNDFGIRSLTFYDLIRVWCLTHQVFRYRFWQIVLFHFLLFIFV